MTNVNPFFDVIRNQLFTVYADEEIYVDRDALLNGDNGNVLGTVGPKYKVVTNQEVNDLFSQAFSNLPVERVVDHMNWKENRWQRDFILNGDSFNIDINGLILKTKVSIFNGYDGKSSVGFSVSAYREEGNVTYLNNSLYTQKYVHVRSDLVDRIRNDFENKMQMFSDTVSLLRTMDRATFTGEQFETFIRSRIREGNENGYLSDRQAQTILDSYEDYIHVCGVRRTRFGAYTVLSAIANNDFRGRNNSSPVFTEGFKRMERLAQDFFGYELDNLFIME